MSRDRFASIVLGRLESEGHEEPELSRLKDQIIKAAGDRLVFLVGLEANEVGFEIRSLQEFMAAEALMEGSDAHVTARLREIAGVTSWRNVLLFAAGNCFSNRQYLRDTIYAICSELNDGGEDPLAPIIRPGSILATDLLADEFARQQPVYRRLLTSEALKGVGHPSAVDRLHAVYQDTLSDLYGEAVAQALGDDTRSRRACIALLTKLSSTGYGWAESILDGAVTRADEILEVMSEDRGSWVEARVDQMARELTVVQIRQLHGSLLRFGSDSLPDSVLTIVRAYGIADRLTISVVGIPQATFNLTISPLQAPQMTRILRSAEAEPTEEWPRAINELASIQPFVGDPSPATLGAVLRQIAENIEPIAWGDLARLAPWPVLACVKEAGGSAERLQALAELAESGELGTATTWATAEKRWLDYGVSAADFDFRSVSGAALDNRLGERGFPAAIAEWRLTIGGSKNAAEALASSIELIGGDTTQRDLAFWALQILEVDRHAGRGRAIPADAIAGFIPRFTTGQRSLLHFRAVAVLRWGTPLSEMEAEALETVGSRCVAAARASTGPSASITSCPSRRSSSAGGKAPGPAASID